jgi:predicted nucleotidyltransferase
VTARPDLHPVHGCVQPRSGRAAHCSSRLGCGSIGLAMSSDVTALDPALAEREGILLILRERAPRLRALGITHLSLFGWMARGEAGPESDIDLLIETESAAKLGLFDLFDLREELGHQFGRPVSFAFRSQMRPWLQE